MSEARYVADPAESMRSVELDGLTLLYHRPSGMTHILAAPAPQLLDLLAGRPATIRELRERIHERFELADAEALEARVGELEAAGLVSRT